MSATDILVKIGADITQFSRAMAESQKALTKFTQENQATFDAFKKTGSAVTAFGVATVGGLGFAVKKAAEFESGMSKVAAISGATGEDFDKLSQKAREMGAATSFSATDAASGLEYMALAGWKTEQMLGGIEPILHLAEAGALDLGRASDLVTDSMAALGLEVEDLSGYLDKVAQTAANSNTDIDMLMDAMVIAGGTFSRFNVPLAEANAFLGVLANRGTKASEAGTAINAIMDRLTSGTGAASDALEELNISAFDSEGKFRGMEVVMRDINDRLSQMTDKEKAHYQSLIAGLNHGKSFEKMLQGLNGEYAELKGKIENADGALLQMRNTMKDNLQGALENLSSAFEEIMIAVGYALLPYVKKIVSGLQNLADWFNGLSESAKSFTALGTAIVGVLSLIAGPILLLIGFIPQIIVGFKAIGGVFAALTGPVGLTIAAILGVIAALVVAYKKVDWFRNRVDGVWAQIKVIFEKALGKITEVVKKVMADVTELFGEGLAKVRVFWDENGEMIMKIVKLYFGGVKTYVTTVLGVLKGLFKNAWTIISNVTKVLWGVLKTVVRIGIDGVLGAIQFVLKILQGDWKGAWNTIKDTLGSIWSNIGRFIKETDLVKVWNDVIDGLSDGFKTMIDAISKPLKKVGGFFDKYLVTPIKELFTVFGGKGKEKATSIFDSLTEKLNIVGAVIKSVVDKAIEFFGPLISFFETVWTNISETTSTIWESLSTTLSTIWDNIKITAGAMWELIKNVILGPILLLINLVTGDMEEFYKNLFAIWTNIGNAGNLIWTALKDSIIALSKFAVTTVKTLWDGFSKFLSDLWEFTVRTATNAWRKFKDSVTSLAATIVTSVKQKFEEMKTNVIKKIAELITTALSKWDELKRKTLEKIIEVKNNVVNPLKEIDLKQIGKDIINGLIRGIKDKVNAVKDAVKDVTDAITGKIKSILKIASPSKVLTQIGRWTGEGLAKGIQYTTGLVSKASAGLADAATPQISMAYATPSGTYASLSSAVNGTVDVDTRDSMLAEAIGKLESKLENMRIELDGREFGRAVSDASSNARNAAVRSRGGRRV